MNEVKDEAVISDESRKDISSTLVELKEVASGSNTKLTDSIHKLFKKPGSSSRNVNPSSMANKVKNLAKRASTGSCLGKRRRESALDEEGTGTTEFQRHHLKALLWWKLFVFLK